MPSCPTVLFNGTHADAYKPTSAGYNHWHCYTPENPETFAANATTTIDLHFTVCIPHGHVMLITAHTTDIIGAPECHIIPTSFIGNDGSHYDFKLQVINLNGGPATPTPGEILCHFNLVPTDEIVANFTGTWE